MTAEPAAPPPFDPIDPLVEQTPAIEGGEPIRSEPWPTYERGDVWIDERDEKAAIEAIRENLYFRYDERAIADTYVGRFERDLCAFFGVANALACTSGTTAIALSLIALQLPAGARVACPAFTFAATPSAIVLAGAAPVLVECDENLHLDVDDLRRVLDEGVDAVVVVHMRGFASDMDAICALAARYDVPVVEDAVPALGASLRGRLLGTFGRFGAFSTQSDKSLNTGEGGFLISDDTETFARAVVCSGTYEGRASRHFDTPPDIDEFALPIFSFRMDEIRAALADSLLIGLPERLRAHKRVYREVAAGLADIPCLSLRRPVADDAFLGEALVFRLAGCDVSDAVWFADALRAEGIDARALGDPHRPNVRAFWNWRFLVGDDPAAARARYPTTARYVCEAIDIPLSANLSQADCLELVAAIQRVSLAFEAR